MIRMTSRKAFGCRRHNYFDPVTRLGLHPLESRITPALTIGFSYQTGLLSVASDAADAIVVNADSEGQVRVNYSLFLADGQPLRATAVSSISISGGPGANLIDLSGVNAPYFLFPHWKWPPPDLLNDSAPPVEFHNLVILGGAGHDTISGSPFDDYIDGGLGNDSLNGSRGDDVISWDWGDSGVNGGAGVDQGFLSLDGLAPTVPAIQAAVVPTGTVTFTVDGINRSASSLELIDVNGGSFGPTDITILMGATAAATCTVKFKEASRVSVPTAAHSSKPKEIVVVGSKSSSDVATLLSFEFDGEIHLNGGAFADEFTITPGPNKININGGGDTDSLMVNHLGYAATQTTGLVQVTGRAAVNHVNIESVMTGRTVFGPAAENELKAGGVTTTAVWSTVGFLDVGTVTIKNQSALPLTNVSIELGGTSASAADPQLWAWHEVVRLGEIVRLRGTGGLVALVNPNPQGTPIADILNGESAYSPRVIFSAVTIPAGGIAVATIEMSRSPFHRVKYGDIVLKKGWNTSNYDFRLVGVVESSGDIDQPVILGSLANGGKSSSSAGSSIAGVSADGAAFVQVSSALDLDPYVTSISPGNHVFVNNVMVDTIPAGNSSGNGSSSEPVISADGRWVAFTTNASDLIATGGADLNGVSDVAVRDLFTGKLTVISRTSTGLTGNGKSFAPQISADGRYVFFLSEARNLVGGVSDANASTDLFRFDTSTNQLACMSVTPAGTATGNKGVDSSSVTGLYSISAAGDVVAWFSEATDLFVAGAPAGMHAVHKKGANHPDFAWWPTGSPQQGLRVTGDGSKVILWTDADLSTQTGVLDSNSASDLFAWDPTAGKVQAISINSAKTNMGDGPTPGSPNDAPAVSYDGSTIAFTSDADNLVLGLSIPTEDGLHRYRSFFLIDRTDSTSTGYGGNNHTPTISPDGRVIAWSSATNYGSGSSTFSQPQVWVKSAAETTENVSGRYGLNPNFATGRPLLADAGHVVFFDSQSPMAGVDTNSFVDVYASVSHESLVFDFGGSKGSPSIDVETKKLERRYVQINDSSTTTNAASRPVDTTRWVFLYGADNESNAVNFDYGTGLAGLANIFFDGGVGTGVDTANQSGGGDGIVDLPDFPSKFRLQHVSMPVLELTLGDVEQLNNKLYVGGLSWRSSGIHSANIDIIAATGETHVSFAAAGGYQFDAYFDTLSALAYLGGAGQTSGGSSITLNSTGSKAEPLPVLMVIANRDFNVIDAAKMTITVTIVGGSGNDTINGGSANDIIAGGVGNDQLKGGNGDDTYLFDSFFDVFAEIVTDTGGLDTLDFSQSRDGIALNLSQSGPQTLTALGHVVSLNGQFERFVGSSFDDQATTKSLFNGVYYVEGVRHVYGTSGDKLVFDAQGKAATDLAGKIFSANKLAVNHLNIDTVQIINNAPPPQVAAVIINDGAVQRSMVTSIVVAFNGPVSFVGAPASAFQLNGPNGTVVLNAAPQTVNGQTNVRLTFTAAPNIGGSLADGMNTLRVVSSQVAGGLVGGDYVSASGAIHRLFGDADGNASITASDFNALRLAYGTGTSIFDFDADGLTSATDFNQFRLRYGVMLVP